MALRIKEAREAARLSQEELGRLVGVGKVQISKWETGLHKPQVDMVRAIAEALGTTTDYLLGATVDPRPPSRSAAEVALSIVAEVIDTVREPTAPGEADPRAERIVAKLAELHRARRP